MLPGPLVDRIQTLRQICASDDLLQRRDGQDEDLKPLFDEWGEYLGLEFLNFGSSRVAFLLGKRDVLKIGYTCCGMQSNRREALASTLIPPEIHAVVKACSEDGLWLVQEYASSLTSTAERDWAQSRTAMYSVAKLVEQAARGIVDYSGDNFGRRDNGDVVLIDIENFGDLQAVLLPEEQEARRWLSLYEEVG